MKNRKKALVAFLPIFRAILQIANAMYECYNMKMDGRVAGWVDLYSLEWG